MSTLGNTTNENVNKPIDADREGTINKELADDLQEKKYALKRQRDKERFATYSDDELIRLFNREVDNNGWGSARALHLSLIREEFIARGYDYSAVGDDRSISYAKKIKLEEKVIVIAENILAS